ncbi:Hypothetical protein NTJ_01461 [Nesidiocoris tenuis]|uniref:Uncharacterized protein n=1 Tax=Nesidiocoris tenuis TaxID=355587 RepID=A0ABN7A9J0_9HEMI|nr:Hypothetical protein NTJ_01461 [Nesidiocoris tenuis]
MSFQGGQYAYSELGISLWKTDYNRPAVQVDTNNRTLHQLQMKNGGLGTIFIYRLLMILSNCYCFEIGSNKM